MDLFKKKVIDYYQSYGIGGMLLWTTRSAGAHNAST